MAQRKPARQLSFTLVALVLIGTFTPPVTAATKSTKTPTTKKATTKKATSALPACRANREAMLVTLRSGKVYRCTKVSLRSFKWRPASSVPTAPPASTASVPPTSGPTTPTTTPEPAPTSTAPEPTAPAATITSPTSTTPASTTTTTSVTTTTAIIPASGPGTLRISVSGVNRVPAEFTLKCIKPGFGRETRYSLVSGESVEVRSLPAPIDCVISGLVATGVPIQPKATDSSTPTNDLKATVLPLPSPPALFTIQNGAREIDPTGGTTPPLKTN